MSLFFDTPTNRIFSFPSLLLTAVAVTFFLLFIDEGYYDFRWMKSPGNWVVGGIYAFIIFLMELLFVRVLFKRVSGAMASFFVLFCGVITGVVAAVSIFMAISS